MNRELRFSVNGRVRTVETEPDRPLLEVLREDLSLTGTKYGCGEGHCAACTVLLEGKTVLSCQTTVSEAEGKAIITIEGLAIGERLHPVQQAFLTEAGFQCGYCTPGMILSTVGLLKEKPEPGETEIRTWLNPHLCRCCGYPKILRAVRLAATLNRRTTP